MFTPSEINQQEPAKNDRPYAGFFHTEFNYLSLTSHQAHRFNLTLGMLKILYMVLLVPMNREVGHIKSIIKLSPILAIAYILNYFINVLLLIQISSYPIYRRLTSEIFVVTYRLVL